MTHAKLFTRFSSTNVGDGASESPHFHLFHAPNSVCSQKVRVVLLATRQRFASHVVNIFAGENYDPLYVRTRAQACTDASLPFGALHTGSTSVVETGCDACVVPTFIDDQSGEVLVDSLKICKALSRRFGGDLRPPELTEAIDREIAEVDSLPNYPLLAAKVSTPAADGTGNAFAMGKVYRCNTLIAQHADDPLLVAAYTAKRDKELTGNTGLFTPEAIARAEAIMQTAFANLDTRLSDSQKFLFGDTLSLADIFWAVVLIRADDLDYRQWIDRLPRLSRYYEALCAVPPICRAIIEWPEARIRLKVVKF